MDSRRRILGNYAKWTARAAVGAPGAPIRAGRDVYRLLGGVAFAEVLLGDEIAAEAFNAWHERETVALCCRANLLRAEVGPYPVGWSAKLINVYLKTSAYVGDLGREGLRDALHPPLDNRLRVALLRRFEGHPTIPQQVSFPSISAIATYPQYLRIIEGCREAAGELAKQWGECSLFEVERLWRP